MTIRGSTESTHCPECGGIHHPSELTEGLCPIGLFDLLDDSHAETIDGVLRAAERRAADFPGGVAAAGAGAKREEARRPGLTIPGYTVGDELARGGMGIVYRARQHAPDRDVAIKMLLPFSAAVPELRERFQVEVRTLAELDHSAILPIYETGDYEGLPRFAMKLAAGGSLAARIGTFAGQWRSIATLVATLADATHYAHERGVLHRDLKPGNILFDAEARAFVADFGLAKFMDEEGDLTRTHRAMGTPRYLAPEVAAGSARHATTASDIYSLGAILFELLTGRPPFEAEGLPDLLRRIADEEPRFPSHGSGEKIPVDLQVIALKCLAKIPASRYASARELAGELRSFLAGEPILARPSSRMEKLWRWTRREPALTSALGACGLILALGAVAVLRQLQETETARGIAVQKAREIEVQRGLAEAARTQAQQSELTMRQNLYAADMLAAQRAIDQNDLGTARLRLAAHRPAAGQSDLRGWEWRYFWGRARGQSFATVKPNDGPLTVLQFIDEGKRLAISNWQTFLYRLPSLELDTKIETPSVQSLAYAPDTGTMFFGIRGPSEVRRWTPGDRPDALSFVLDPKGRSLAECRAVSRWPGARDRHRCGNIRLAGRQHLALRASHGPSASRAAAGRRQPSVLARWEAARHRIVARGNQTLGSGDRLSRAHARALTAHRSDALLPRLTAACQLQQHPGRVDPRSRDRGVSSLRARSHPSGLGCRVFARRTLARDREQ